MFHVPIYIIFFYTYKLDVKRKQISFLTLLLLF